MIAQRFTRYLAVSALNMYAASPRSPTQIWFKLLYSRSLAYPGFQCRNIFNWSDLASIQRPFIKKVDLLGLRILIQILLPEVKARLELI